LRTRSRFPIRRYRNFAWLPDFVSKLIIDDTRRQSESGLGIEPHQYLSLLFARLPDAKSVGDFEALLPWRVSVGMAVAQA
jgi:IS66 C-terminal element